MKRNLIGVAAALSLMIPVGVVTAGPAGAAPLQSCTKLTVNVALSPGIQNTPQNQTLTATGTIGGCTPAAATGGSGKLSAVIKIPNGSCAKLAMGNQKITGTGSTTWTNKKVSKFSLTATTGSGKNALLATLSGKVTSGLFAGKKIGASVGFKVPPPVPDCSPAHPVKKLTIVLKKPFTLS